MICREAGSWNHDWSVQGGRIGIARSWFGNLRYPFILARIEGPEFVAIQGRPIGCITGPRRERHVDIESNRGFKYRVDLSAMRTLVHIKCLGT